MTRWSQYDEDEYRLPEGMRRVGYDADTEVYTFQDEDGSYWEGNPGERFGQMHRVGSSVPPSTSHVYDGPQIPSRDPAFRHPGYTDNSWRYLAPFFLLICLFLLIVYKILGGGNWPLPGPSGLSPIECAKNQELYEVKKGDTCWSIAKNGDMSLQQLESMNVDLDCNKLQIGQDLCVKDLRLPKENGRIV